MDKGVSLHSNTVSHKGRRRLYEQTSSEQGSEVKIRQPRRISDFVMGHRSRSQKMNCSYSLSDHEEEDKMIQGSVQRSLRQRIDKRIGIVLQLH